MAAIRSYPLRRERDLILLSLALVAAGAWAVLIWQSRTMSNMTGLTMGMAAPLFIAVWIAMMVAMMFPASAPMILMFARIYTSKRERGQPFVPTWVFAGAYLLVWAVAGVLAYGAAAGVDELAKHSMWLTDNGTRIAGGLLIAAGLYQLSPLKNVCLAKCRSPLGFIMTSWRDGYGGAARMGVQHGAYCLGCCWLLFVILFPLGMMNIAALAAVTVLIFAEKTLPYGRITTLIAAAGLIIYGIVVIAVPGALPSMMSGGSDMNMNMHG